MRLPSVSISLITLVVISSAQTPYNSLLHGIILDGGDASSLAQGSSGLVPSFDSRFSVSNPATWSSLRFAYLTTHYGSGRIEYPDRDFSNDFGQLRNIAFIVPIKERFAWGIGIRPYSRKTFLFESEEDSVLFSGKSLTLSKKIEGDGGISSLFTGGSWKIDDRRAAGVRLDFLFGVFSEVTSSHLDNDRPTLLLRHFRYKGTLLSLYYTVSPGRPLSNSTVYLGGQLPIGEREVMITESHLFSDQNLDGRHSSGPIPDRPLPEDVSETQTRIPFSPSSTFSLGWVYHLTQQTHLNVEFVARTFPRGIDQTVSSLPGEYREKTDSRLSVGILRERVSTSRDFLNRFHYHVGFFRREHYISRSNGSLTEEGIAVGIGIPFGPALNQMDFGFRFSKREGFLSDEPEFVSQLALGLTLGDLWLVKRRRK